MQNTKSSHKNPTQLPVWGLKQTNSPQDCLSGLQVCTSESRLQRGCGDANRRQCSWVLWGRAGGQASIFLWWAEVLAGHHTHLDLHPVKEQGQESWGSSLQCSLGFRNKGRKGTRPADPLRGSGEARCPAQTQLVGPGPFLRLALCSGRPSSLKEAFQPPATCLPPNLSKVPTAQPSPACSTLQRNSTVRL